MTLVAITGSIGCGKTTIAQILRDLGYIAFDADKWVKYVYYKKEFLVKLRREFPEVFDNESLDKKKLRNIVFSNKEKLEKLENLIYPFLKNNLRKISRKNKYCDLLFFDAALLYEKKWDKYFDYVILADVEKEVQKQRVIKRDGISEDDFEKINCIQMPMDIKREKADFIINTNTSIKKLKKRILEVMRFLK